jgi:hypothetical protein
MTERNVYKPVQVVRAGIYKSNSANDLPIVQTMIQRLIQDTIIMEDRRTNLPVESTNLVESMNLI